MLSKLEPRDSSPIGPACAPTLSASRTNPGRVWRRIPSRPARRAIRHRIAAPDLRPPFCRNPKNGWSKYPAAERRRATTRLKCTTGCSPTRPPPPVMFGTRIIHTLASTIPTASNSVPIDCTTPVISSQFPIFKDITRIRLTMTENTTAPNNSPDLKDVLQKVSNLRIWVRRGQTAPHKPLLMLYALGQYSQGIEELPFATVDTALRKLLREFGPGLRHLHTEYPFWRLQNDQLWLVTADDHLEHRSGNTDIKRSELISKNAIGEFTTQVKRILKSDPRNMTAIATLLLENNFPDTLHQDILDSVGLRLDVGGGQKRRSPEFRREVLRAYESRCCVCGYDVRLGDTPAGLEAAHIKWFQAGGPDSVSNGLALCTLHHKLFDLGAFTIDPNDLILTFSQDISGTNQIDWLLAFHGRSMRQPQSEIYLPRREYLDWHQDTIFRSPQRDIARAGNVDIV